MLSVSPDGQETKHMNKLLAQTLNLPWQSSDGSDTTVGIEGPLTDTGLGLGGGDLTLGFILSRAMDFVFIFAGIGLFLMLLVGGFTFLTSAGDSKTIA